METVRAWKDPSYRRAVGQVCPEVVAHPAGVVALTEDDLETATGGGTPATITTSSWICGATVASILGCPSLRGTCGFFTSGCC